MIGDTIHLKPHHLLPAGHIAEQLGPILGQSENAYSVTIAGESGCGKSTLALALKKILEKQNRHVFVFHIDDYFKLPPADNHKHRLQDLAHVGPHEVNMKLLQQHIDKAKEKVEILKKPQIDYKLNVINEVTVQLSETDVIIAEGTYTSLLENIDCKIFMLHTYKDTYQKRKKRARDPFLPFIEQVLQIEHEYIKSHAKRADIIVDRNYEIHNQNN